MKKFTKYTLLAFVAAAIAVSCSEWTEPEQAMPTDKVSNIHDETYYANLRAYRESDHSIMCGYYQGWGGKGASLKSSLMSFPDSVDILSMWGAGFHYTPSQIADLKEAQEKKGIKCLLVFILHSVGAQITPSWVGEASPENPVIIHDRDTGEPIEVTSWLEGRRVFWGMDKNDSPRNTAEMNAKAVRAVERYADSLCYIIDRLGLDGFDWDFEYGYQVGDDVGDIIGDHSTYCNAQQAHDRTLAFARRMREGLGDKILMIDGVPHSMRAPEACVYFDYFAQQAYARGGNGGSETAMDNRTNNMINAFRAYLDPEFVANRTVMLETFEDTYQKDGRTYYGWETWRLRNGAYSNYTGGSFEGMARWNPVVNGKEVRKGGIGAYLIQNDYAPRFTQYKTYPQVREAIQIMNPAVQ